MASELEYYLQDTVDWGKKWLVHINAGKTQMVSLDQSNNTAATDVKMDESVLEDKSSLRCWDWLSLLNWIGALTLSQLLKVPWSLLWSFVLLRLLCILVNLPYSNAWNTDVMYELVLLVATLNCYISYKSEYEGLMIRHLLSLLNPWLIIEMQSAYIFSIGIIWTGWNWFHLLFSRKVYSLFW